MARSFDEIVDISRLNDDDASLAINERGVDVLLNLNGYFGRDRSGLFRRRPCGIQVNYLGFPGTLGASYIDYLIADRTVVPKPDKNFYCENIVYLPDSYQPNDRARLISERQFTREEVGLPNDSFVYCCFNHKYKITPDHFQLWMDILKNVSNSVLWLLSDDPQSVINLRSEAKRGGVDPDRMVFAPRLLPPDHLARHRLADLFLDTLPYNAHTTGSDALWAGLPVLTLIGNTFPGRVGASFLNAVGLPELVTNSAFEYKDKAIGLAKDPRRLRSIKEALSAKRLTAPLFDTPLYTKHLETAYATMVDRRNLGLPPDSFSVCT